MARAARSMWSAVGLFTSFVSAVAASPPRPVDVRISISVDARDPADGYVALIAPEQPVSRPAAEAIITRGTATLRVIPGAYRALIGAAGAQDEFRAVIVKEGIDLRFALKPSKLIGGNVVDSTGQPVRRARVSEVRVTGSILVSQYSAAAHRYFSAQETTVTDDNGHWMLPAPVSGKRPIVIEADGFAPAIVNPAVGTTSLRRGAILRVTFDRSDPDFVVTLAGDGGENSIEQRVLSRGINNKGIEWTLRPGGYRLIGRYPDPRRFSARAELGVVTLVEGQSASISATLPPLARPDANTTVLFVAHKTSNEMAAMDAFVTRSSGSAEWIEHSIEPVSGGVLVYARARARPSEFLLLTPGSVIVARKNVENDVMHTVVSDRADISVRVKRDAEDVDLPKSAKARFTLCDFDEQVFLGTNVGRNGELRLPFPTSCRGLLLQLPPFEPVILEAGLAAGETRSFGPYVLKIGGVAEVHAVHDPGGFAAVRADITVSAFSEEKHHSVIVDEGVADEDGKLVLTGLPINRDVTVDATDAVSGLSGTASVRVSRGKVARIDPLAIPLPAKVTIAPKFSREFLARFPDAKIRLMTLRRTANGHDQTRTEELSEKGEVIFENLPPGEWHPLALVEAAESLQPVAFEDLQLRSGEERHTAPLIEPAVFEGRVTSRGKGVAAIVSFGEPPSPTAVIRFSRASSSGRFTIILPAPGIYDVDVTLAEHPNDRIDLGEVDLSDPGRPVMLDLPDHDAVARVHDGNRPVANATVTARLVQSSLRAGVTEIVRIARTDAAGEARLESLAQGRWVVEARNDTNRKTAQVSLDVVESETASVDLILESPLVVAGFVHDAHDVAVAGARVDCFFAGAGNLPQSVRGDSDFDGHFSIDLPTPSPPNLYCGVTTPGGAIAAYQLSPTTSADFRLPAETAALSIPDWGAHLSHDLFWLVSDDGRLFSLSWAAGRIGKLWSPLAIPELPTGSWKIVSVGTVEEWIRLAGSGGNALRPLAEFTVKKGDLRKIELYSKTTKGAP